VIFDYCFELLQETVQRPAQFSVLSEGSLRPVANLFCSVVPFHLLAPTAWQGTWRYGCSLLMGLHLFAIKGM